MRFVVRDVFVCVFVFAHVVLFVRDVHVCARDVFMIVPLCALLDIVFVVCVWRCVIVCVLFCMWCLLCVFVWPVCLHCVCCACCVIV